MEELETLYQSVISDRKFLDHIISTNQFKSWITIDLDEDPVKHRVTLEFLKKKLIELEYYEQVIIVDNYIKELMV